MPNLMAGQVSYPVQAILFDKDGTLMDFICTWGYWGEQMLARFFTALEAKGLVAEISTDPGLLWGTVHAVDGRIVDYSRNGPLAMGTMEDMKAILAWQGYRAGLSWADARVLVDKCWTFAEQQLEQARAVQAIPGVIAFLEQCLQNGLKMAVVTADETAAAEKHLAWLGIRHYFSVCIGTDQVEHGKPFPDMVLLACRELGVAPSEVAVIGDTSGDMRMAQLAGAAVGIGLVDAAGTDTGSDERHQLLGADVIISGYHELSIGEGQ